jgi:hypothetical protein
MLLRTAVRETKISFPLPDREQLKTTILFGGANEPADAWPAVFLSNVVRGVDVQTGEQAELLFLGWGGDGDLLRPYVAVQLTLRGSCPVPKDQARSACENGGPLNACSFGADQP